MTDQDIENKLSAARTRLIIDKPFLGALTLRLPLVAADPAWCYTTATDAKTLFYNPEYIRKLSLAETQFVLAHEALHCALSHFARRQHRIKLRWDIACDFAINPLLSNDGLIPPAGVLLEKSYEGMTAEEIYPYIEENSELTTLDHHVYDQQSDIKGGASGTKSMSPPPESDQTREKITESAQGAAQDNSQNGKPQKQQDGSGDSQQSDEAGAADANTPADQSDSGNGKSATTSLVEQDNGAPCPPPLTEIERESLQVQWQQRMAGAAQQAMQAGKLGGDLRRMVDHLLQPQLPWRSLLAHYVSCVARDDYSYARPNSRRGGPAIYPSLRSDEVDMVVALDTSGSISDAEMAEFISEVNAIKGQLRARIIFHVCDVALSADGPWIFEAWENFEMPQQIDGGGATDFSPVFEWQEQQDRQPQLLVYFTDAEGSFPQRPPSYPVIWLVKGKAAVPWGQRVQLN